MTDPAAALLVDALLAGARPSPELIAAAAAIGRRPRPHRRGRTTPPDPVRQTLDPVRQTLDLMRTAAAGDANPAAVDAAAAVAATVTAAELTRARDALGRPAGGYADAADGLTAVLCRYDPTAADDGVGLVDAPLFYAADRWEPFAGPRGGKGWRDRQTGKVIYGERPGTGERVAVPAPAAPSAPTAAPAAAVGEVLADLNRADVTDEHVAAVTRTLAALPKAQLHALRSQLGLPEKGLKGATRDRLVARLIAHARGEPAGGGSVEDLARQVSAARRGEEVDAPAVARRLEALTLADLRALRDRIGGAAGGRSRADVSTRILAALHRRDAGAAPGRRPVDPRQMTIDWGALAATPTPEPATEQPAPVSPAPPPPPSTPDAPRLNLSGLTPGTPEPVENLRARAGLSKQEFDRAVLAAADRGEVVLHQHNAPASLTPEQRDHLVADPSGKSFYGYVALPEKSRENPASGGDDVDIPEYPADVYALSDAQRASVARKLGLPTDADERTVAMAIADRQEQEESPPAAKPSNSSPQYDVSRSEYDGKTQLIFKHGGKEVGEIAAVTRPDGNWEVSNVLVWPGFQRQGHGTAFYRRLADEAHRQGKRLFISNDRTDDAKALHAQAERAGWLKPTGEVAFPTNPPPAPPAAAPPAPEEPEDAATVRKRERERWTGQLDRIGVGDSGYVGGVFVRRTGPEQWRAETDRGFVQGDAERLLQHVARTRQDTGLYGRQLKEALARFKSAPRDATPGGGGLFGGDDLKAQQGFARLPQGAAVAITEGGYRGRVGRIVREETAPGRYRVLVRPEGSGEAVPIHHGSVEPLDPKLSWRVDRGREPPPARQNKLFARGDSLPYLRQARRALAAGDRAGARLYLRQAIRYGARRAPKGGVTVAGTFYPGGRFIPGEAIAAASPAERAALGGERVEAPRRARPAAGQMDLFGGGGPAAEPPPVPAPPPPPPPAAAKQPPSRKGGKVRPLDLPGLFDPPPAASVSGAAAPPAPPPKPSPAPPPPPESERPASPPPPTPGYSGTDTLGRRWEGGRLTGGPTADDLPPDGPRPADPLFAGRPTVRQVFGIDPPSAEVIGALAMAGVKFNTPAGTPLQIGFFKRMIGVADALMEDGFIEQDEQGYRLTKQGALAMSVGVLTAAANQGGGTPEHKDSLPPFDDSEKSLQAWATLWSAADGATRQQILDTTGLVVPVDAPYKVFLAQMANRREQAKSTQSVRRLVRTDPELVALADRIAASGAESAELEDAAAKVEGAMGELCNTYLKAERAGDQSTMAVARAAIGVAEQQMRTTTAMVEAARERQRATLRDAIRELVPPIRQMQLRPDAGAFTGDPRPLRAACKFLDGLFAAEVAAGTRPRHAFRVENVAQDRANCNAAGDEIRLEASSSTRTVVHEIGHTLELRHPSVLRAARRFVAERCGDEPPRPMKDINPLLGYRDDEYGRSDDFGRLHGDGPDGRVNAAYSGKLYLTGGTEIVSMGLEHLYHRPAQFARRDPEYFAFMVGVLTGRARLTED